MLFVAEEVRTIIAALGYRSLDEARPAHQGLRVWELDGFRFWGLLNIGNVRSHSLNSLKGFIKRIVFY